MPGFGPIGVLAVGTGPGGSSSNTILNVTAASYAVTASAVSFKFNAPVAAASYALTAVALVEKFNEPVASASFAVSTTAPSFAFNWPIASATFAATFNALSADTKISAVSYALTFRDVPLIWTGAGVDTSYSGGVGHYKWELEEAARLAAITTRGPPGFVDLRSPVRFDAIGAPPIAPAGPAPDLAAIAQQQASAQMQAAQAAKKRRRDIEAILLLAA